MIVAFCGEQSYFLAIEGDGDPTHRDVEAVCLQTGFEGRPTRLHNFQPHAERLRKAHRHVHVDTFDRAGSVSERERPLVLGQTDAKRATSHDRIKARGCRHGRDQRGWRGGRRQKGQKEIGWGTEEMQES
jgi:hypothetical protein